MPRHYAFLPVADERVSREKYLAERSIFPIWYPNEDGGHAMLSHILWWLNSEVREKGVDI
jgi:hypothetical protein